MITVIALTCGDVTVEELVKSILERRAADSKGLSLLLALSFQNGALGKPSAPAVYAQRMK